MQRLFGIDYGIRRIGIAIGDTETRIAMPLSKLDGRNDVTRDARQVTDLGAAEGVDGFVVGLPLNMNGTDSEQTRLTRRFAEELTRLSGKAVHLEDERLSSWVAEQVLEEAGIRGPRRSGRTDSIAAQKILQSYFDRIETPQPPG